MLATADRKQLIEKVRSLPDAMEAAVKDLSDAQLDTPYRAGGWTIRQVVHHVADSHMNAFARMKLLLTEEHPTIRPYDQERWAELSDTRSLPVHSSLAILRGLHQRWSALMESLPEGSWDRRGFHPESGEITVESLLATYSRHGENHVNQILGLRRGRSW